MDTYSAPRLSPSSQTAPGNESAALSLPDKPSIVVLPFTNMSGDPEQEYFSDGMTDTLITDLSRVSGLFVIARNSAFAYKGPAVDIAEVSRKLGVRYVLESSVQKAGGRLRINTQLVDATTGGHVWADRYDRQLDDLFALQDELTQQIVTALEVELTAGEQASLYRHTTTNLAAYDLFLRAMTYTMRYTEEGNAQGRQLFEQALALDPAYVDAYTMLGWSYFHEWVFQWSHDPQVLEQAFALAQQGIALDASVAEPHLLLGFVYLWRDRQHERAIAEGEQALALAPNYSWAYANLAEMLLYVGRHEEALQLMEQAMRLDPRYPAPYPFLLGQGYRGLGQYEEAEDAYKKALALNPDFWPAHSGLTILYSELGREKEARAEAAKLLKVNPHFSVEVTKQRMPYKDPAMVEQIASDLRKAGLE